MNVIITLEDHLSHPRILEELRGYGFELFKYFSMLGIVAGTLPEENIEKCKGIAGVVDIEKDEEMKAF